MSNIMTEEEARKRWCPFARSYGYPSGGEESEQAVTVNRGRNNKPDQWCRCIASDCMSWRWEKDTLGLPSKKNGYCGLAGAPAPSGVAAPWPR